MINLFDVDSETAVLSLILKHPERIYDLTKLKPFMFSSIPNKELFKEYTRLSEIGLVPEFNLVTNSLAEQNKVNDVGGVDYLKYLYSLQFDVKNLREFEKIVLNSYKARSLISLSGQLPDMVNANESNIDDVISYVKNSLDGIATNMGGEETFSLEDITRIAWNKILEKVGTENKITHTCGIKNLDSITGGYLPGDLWVIASRPSVGKTATLCNSILTGVPTLVFSLEMQKDLLVYRLASIKTGISAFNIRFGILSQKELNLVGETLKEIKNLPIFIDSNYFSDINYVISTIKKFKKIHNIEVIHLDYLQLLVERGLYQTHELGRVTRELKLLSNDLGITSVIYSQLNRLVELREDKRPILSDLRQSGNIEEDADIVIMLYRDYVYNKQTKERDLMELLLRKHRNGPTGMIPTSFDESSGRIIDKL